MAVAPQRDRTGPATDSMPRMPDTPRTVQRTYLVLILLQTLASSFIWGINTLFLLDAGLSNTEAFAANAFYAIGQVLFSTTGCRAVSLGM